MPPCEHAQVELQPADADAARLRAAAALRIDAVTVAVVAAMREVGVEPVLLKGPTLATLLYPEGGRTYSDCDLLVAKHDVDAATRVVATLGFASTQAGYAPSERDEESITFVRANPSGTNDVVDLHWNLHMARDPVLTWTAFEHERDHIVLAGRPITCLSIAARAFHVALHAAQHGLLGPQRFELGGQTGDDLGRALRVIPRSEWERAAEIAATVGAAAGFAYGLRLNPDGAVLADALGLSTAQPELWRYRNTVEPARGATSLHRILGASTRREKLRVLGRSIVPSRARVRNVANSRVGRASLAGAYAEYWVDAARGLPRAAMSAIELRKAAKP